MTTSKKSVVITPSGFQLTRMPDGRLVAPGGATYYPHGIPGIKKMPTLTIISSRPRPKPVSLCKKPKGRR